MTLDLVQSIVYGPVYSRRFGRSLGVNLMPSRRKICSMNCVYCQYGTTRRCLANADALEGELPSVEAVTEAVASALRSGEAFDQITFSGNGEPTLHPHFAEIVEAVAALRDQYRPEVKVALLSNATALGRAGVRDSLERIDLPILKLDAGSEELFEELNRPAEGIEFDSIVEGLAESGNIYLQTVLMDGKVSNVTSQALSDWMDKLARIQPVEAQVYSIERPVAETYLSLVPPERLDQIALEAHKATGVPVKAYYRPDKQRT